jgi:hypothetical protein
MFINNAFARLGFLALLATCVFAEMPQTAVRDVLYDPSGEAFSGTVTIVPNGFPPSATPPVISIPVEDGLFSVRLTPTTTVSPQAFYSVTYAGPGKSFLWNEKWSVSPHEHGLSLKDVRVPEMKSRTAPSNINAEKARDISLPLSMSDISSLNASLAEMTGSLNTLAANLNQVATTVQTITSTQRVIGEVPVGSINGVNATFTLANTPSQATTVVVCRNGVTLHVSNDYTVSGNVVSFVPAAIPITGDIVTVDYTKTSLQSTPTVNRMSTYRDITLPIPMSDVTGLSSALSQINVFISTLTSNATNLETTVQGLAALTPVYGEVPTGAINGTNTRFALQNVPQNGAITLFKNGLRETVGVDYSLTGQSIVFLSLSAPQVGDSLSVDYTAAIN